MKCVLFPVRYSQHKLYIHMHTVHVTHVSTVNLFSFDVGTGQGRVMKHNTRS